MRDLSRSKGGTMTDPVDLVIMILVSVAAVLLLIAAALTVLRMSRGPSSLDRVVAADVLVAVVIAALALEAIVNRHTTTLPVMLVLSLLGFAGSVAIARFVADRDKATRWEVDDTERREERRERRLSGSRERARRADQQ
jgi:multicomponent Na+:H+ antiporter subunit F